MYKNEVNSAFEILLEEIEIVFSSINQEIEAFSKTQNYKKIIPLAENATNLSNFREKVKELQKEWRNVFTSKIPEKLKKIKREKKLQKGLRTPEEDFQIPVLESLVELNGIAKVNDILKKVYEKMKDKLNSYDLKRLPNNPQKRWENAAQWSRYTMVKEGLLSSDSPSGTWEITSKGKKYLEENK